MSAINDHYPVIRCICGRTVTLYEDTATCQCGAELSVKPRRDDQVQPWAVVPDGYDLADRKQNKPEIIRWKDAR